MDEIVEIIQMTRDSNGRMQAEVRLENGLTVVKGIKSMTLEAQITRADGTVEPSKVLAESHQNPMTKRRHDAGEVTLSCE